MLYRVYSIFLVAAMFPAFAAAVPGSVVPPTTTVTVTAPPSTETIASSQCDARNLQCCNSVQMVCLYILKF